MHLRLIQYRELLLQATSYKPVHLFAIYTLKIHVLVSLFSACQRYITTSTSYTLRQIKESLGQKIERYIRGIQHKDRKWIVFCKAWFPFVFFLIFFLANLSETTNGMKWAMVVKNNFSVIYLFWSFSTMTD